MDGEPYMEGKKKGLVERKKTKYSHFHGIYFHSNSQYFCSFFGLVLCLKHD